MQTVVFHIFAYTCCAAFFQPFCGMFTIRFNVLNDKAFPHGCYRTLVEYKYKVLEFLYPQKRLIVEKSVISPDNFCRYTLDPLEKVLCNG